MITITQQNKNDYTTACVGADGCGQQWAGLYSRLTAEDVRRTHFHGPRKNARITSLARTIYNGTRAYYSPETIEYSHDD